MSALGLLMLAASVSVPILWLVSEFRGSRPWRIVLGFKNAEGKPPFYFDGHPEPYIELVKELSPPENAISVSTNPAVMFRTEGFWDAPSEFEAVA